MAATSSATANSHYAATSFANNPPQKPHCKNPEFCKKCKADKREEDEDRLMNGVVWANRFGTTAHSVSLTGGNIKTVRNFKFSLRPGTHPNESKEKINK